MNRDVLADRLKGYACILVLFGHVIIGLNSSAVTTPLFLYKLQSFIWTFHVDLWMFLAGYVYSLTGKWKKHETPLKFIGNKLLNLGIPYFFFGSVYILINSQIPSVNTKSSLSDIPKLIYTPVAQYWFLYALFFVFVIWTLLSLFLKDHVITIVLYIAFVLLTKVFRVPLFFLGDSFGCFLAFGLGACFKSLSSHNYKTWIKLSVVVLHLVGVGIIVWTDSLNLFPCFDDIVAVFGILSSIFLIQVISRIKPVSRFLEFTNKYSFPIFLLHTMFTAATRILLMKMGVNNYLIHILIATPIGYAAPVFIGFIASKIPIINFFFYPSRSIKELKSHKKVQPNN